MAKSVCKCLFPDFYLFYMLSWKTHKLHLLPFWSFFTFKSWKNRNHRFLYACRNLPASLSNLCVSLIILIHCCETFKSSKGFNLWNKRLKKVFHKDEPTKSRHNCIKRTFQWKEQINVQDSVWLSLKIWTLC